MQRTLLACCLSVSLFQPPAQVPAVTQNKEGAQKGKAAERQASDPAILKKLIQQLGSEDYAEREAAMKRLQGIGKPALPALREAAKNSGDAEIGRRAQRLVESLDPQVDPLEQMLKEAVQFEEKKEFEKAAELLDKLFKTAKEAYSPGQAAPVTDIPFLTDVALRSARVHKRLGAYENAANAYHNAQYYSNFNKQKREEIERECSAMSSELLAAWDGVVKKKLNDDATLKLLTNKYPLVLLHTRRFAGGGYLQSAFSFIHESAEEDKHRSDVQLLFDNGRAENTFTLNCLVGQENRIADLGKVDFTKDPDPTKVGTDRKSQWSSEGCKAVDGHVYLERIKDDRGNGFFVLFQVVGTDKDSRFVAFVWRKLPGGKVVKRP
jgi:hypothetical protein